MPVPHTVRTMLLAPRGSAATRGPARAMSTPLVSLWCLDFGHSGKHRVWASGSCQAQECRPAVLDPGPLGLMLRPACIWPRPAFQRSDICTRGSLLPLVPPRPWRRWRRLDWAGYSSPRPPPGQGHRSRRTREPARQCPPAPPLGHLCPQMPPTPSTGLHFVLVIP